MAPCLPRDVAAPAKSTARENPGYAVTSVLVRDPGDGTYRLDATDGRRLAIVRGSSVDTQAYPQLQTVPDGAAECLVGRDDWQRAFKLGTPRGRDMAIGFAASPEQF